jgi:hypothetical protein
MAESPVELSLHELARQLSMDRRLVARYVKRGMPRESAAAAREWWLRNVHSRRRRPKLSEVQNQETADSEVPAEPRDVASLPGGASESGTAGGMDGAIERLRWLERMTAEALGRALQEGRIGEASVLRRDHVASLKALYVGEAQLLRHDLAKGKLVSVKLALEMIEGALREVALLIRQLPSLGRDEAERQRLDTFTRGLLEAIKTGASNGAQTYAQESRGA